MIKSRYTSDGKFVEYDDEGNVISTVETRPFTLVTNHCPFCDKDTATIAVTKTRLFLCDPEVASTHMAGWKCTECGNVFEAEHPHVIKSATGKLAFAVKSVI